MNKLIVIYILGVLSLNCSVHGSNFKTFTNTNHTVFFINDGDWENPQNWKNQQLPTPSSNVVIEANAFITGSKSILELEVKEGFNLSIDFFSTLLVSRNLYNEGEISGPGELILSGNSAQHIGGKGSFNNFRISNPSSILLDESVFIYGNLYIDKGNLITKDNLNLKCNFQTHKTAQIAKVSGQISGEVSVEQCYPARRANRLISPSVTTTTSIRANWQENADSYFDNSVPEGHGTHITGINPGSGPAYLSQDGEKGFDFNPSGRPSMFQFVNQKADFKPVDNTDINTLEVGSPYMLLVRGDRTINIYSSTSTPTETRLRAKGEVMTGSYSQTDLSHVKNGFSLIGNPYHAQVDMTKVLENSDNLRKDVYYVWDPKLGGVQNLNQEGGRGAFVVVELPSGSNSSNSEANQYLQPMQAAFVQTIDSKTSTRINFSEDDKVVQPSQTEILSVEEDQYIDIQLYNQFSYEEGSTPSDALRINFGEVYSQEGSDDISKLPNVDENLTRVVDQQLVALERRPFPESEELLPLYVDQYRREEYILKFDYSDLFPGEIYLIDKYLDVEALITEEQSTYTFNVNSSISESKSENRFSLKLIPQSLSTSIPEWSNVRVFPNPTRGSFSISGFELQSDAEMSIFNMVGQEVYSEHFNSGSAIEVHNFNAKAGVYLLKLIADGYEQTFKLVNQN